MLDSLSFPGKRNKMEKFFNRLFLFFRANDSRTVEIYFEALNVWWLFALLYPGLDLGIDPASIYKYIIACVVGALSVAAIIALYSSNRFMLRILILTCYSFFYIFTGITLLTKTPPNILGGFFICQGALATLLSWKLRSKE